MALSIQAHRRLRAAFFGAALLAPLGRAARAAEPAVEEQSLQWFLSQPENQRIIESDMTDEEKKQAVLALPLNQDKFGDDLKPYVEIMAPFISGREVVTSPGAGGGARSYPLGGTSSRGFVGGRFRGQRAKGASRGSGIPSAPGKKGAAGGLNAQPAAADTTAGSGKNAANSIVGGGNYISGGGVRRGGAPEKPSGGNAIGGSGGGGGGGGGGGPPVVPAPILTGVSPASVPIGQATTLALNGGNFASGAVISITGPASLTRAASGVTATQILSGGTFEASMPPGTYQVQVRNLDGKTSGFASLTITPELSVTVPQTFTRSALPPQGYDFYQFSGTLRSGTPGQINYGLANSQPGIYMMWKASSSGLLYTSGWPACAPPTLAEYNAAGADERLHARQQGRDRELRGHGYLHLHLSLAG